MLLKLKENKDSLTTLLYYVILIPFLCPRGFIEISSLYKIFVTLWLFGSIALIGGLFVYNFFFKKKRYKSCLFALIIYYGVFLALTFVSQGGINEGLQKMLAAPALSVFCLVALKDEPKKFLDVAANILIVGFALGITIFNHAIWPFFSIESSILFIGHIQVASQIGMLGIFLGYIMYKIGENKKKAILLIVLSVLTMVIAKTVVTYIVFVVLAVGLVFVSTKFGKKHFPSSPYTFIVVYLLFNIALFSITMFLDGDYMVLNHNISLNGRMAVWDEVFEFVKENFLLGYGAYGAMLEIFWTRDMVKPAEMNYAHNELLQRLLDGGLILLIAFVVLLVWFLKYIKKVEKKEHKNIPNLFFLSFLLIMLIESVTEYYFFMVFLCILAYLPELTSIYEQKNDEEERPEISIKDVWKALKKGKDEFVKQLFSNRTK